MDTISQRWYYEVHDFCKGLSESHGVPLIKVAGMMSVLSPNVTFVSNVKSLESYLETGGDCTVSTYYKQKVKADEIYALSDDCTEDDVKKIIGKGFKTLAFFENIYRPQTSMAVTVDLWQMRWAVKKRLVRKGNDRPSPKQYRIISESIQRRAKRMGIMPHEYQAMTWVEIRGKAF